jgi:hypothetical protein
MSSLETLRVFLGWCTAINLGVLILATIAVTLMRGSAVKIHAQMFGLDEGELSRQYFQYLGQYKIATVVLNLVPYLALRIIG